MRKIAFISYGQGGKPVDAALDGGTSGIDRLSARIKALGVETPGPFGWEQFQTIADTIKKLPKTVQVIIGGTSLGANMAPWIAAKVYPRTVDYIFGIQPSNYGGHYDIPKNVVKALCVYNPLWFMTGGLGALSWPRAADNHTTVLTTRTKYVTHPGSNDEDTQNFILTDIKGLI